MPAPLAPPAHAPARLGWQDRVTLWLTERHYTHAARVGIVADAEEHGSVCCSCWFDGEEDDRAEVEAMLPDDPEWLDSWPDWFAWAVTWANP